MFEIDANGSLRTLVALDYEEASQWTLGATAVNDFNESASRSFVLEVLNLFEPPVNYPPSDLSAPNGRWSNRSSLLGLWSGTFEVFDLNDSGFMPLSWWGEWLSGQCSFHSRLNGTLRNASVMNYYQNKSFSIRVRVTDSGIFPMKNLLSFLTLQSKVRRGCPFGWSGNRCGWRKSRLVQELISAPFTLGFYENLGWLYAFQRSGEMPGFTMKDWVGYGLINRLSSHVCLQKDPIGSFRSY